MPDMTIDRLALGDLARGAAFLGSGGGGDPYYNLLLGEAEIERSGGFRMIDAHALPEDALVAPCGWIGAPTVSLEKLPSGDEAVAGLRRLEEMMGRPIAALMPIEIGGANGLAPLLAASRLGLPVLDADGMGRAFPESQMAVLNIQGLSACPAIVTAAGGALSVIETPDNLEHERLARGLSIAFGGIAHMVEYPLTAGDVIRSAIPGSVSAAVAVGAAIRQARGAGDDPFAAMFDALRATGLYAHAGALFDGKIVDLERRTEGGFSIGQLAIETFDGARRMTIGFQNENLYAREGDTVRAMTPDLVTVMDLETAESITTERLKYGQRVRIVAAAAPAALRTDHALSYVGPGAFGLDMAFVPVEQLNGWTR
ncbi:hypothetical protein FHS96_005509 [Sphingomonas zeicaulis]|uniref:DUF917 domain-containing protein n=1 Tax=Sphingomonas zeicaulis TaxID=1632740 RepID=UPI003D220C28